MLETGSDCSRAINLAVAAAVGVVAFVLFYVNFDLRLLWALVWALLIAVLVLVLLFWLFCDGRHEVRPGEERDASGPQGTLGDSAAAGATIASGGSLNHAETASLGTAEPVAEASGPVAGDDAVGADTDTHSASSGDRAGGVASDDETSAGSEPAGDMDRDADRTETSEAPATGSPADAGGADDEAALSGDDTARPTASGGDTPTGSEQAGDGVADGASGAGATTPTATGAGSAQAAATPDYDKDGVREGTDEGTKPAMLDGPRGGDADNLKEIKGVGPKLEQLLNSLGIYHFDQVASWTADEVAWVDANLKGFKGRVSRDNWVEQSKILASGGETEFSKRVDKGDVY